MPLKAPMAFFDNSLSYGSSVDEELIELTANFDNEVNNQIDLKPYSDHLQEDDTDEGGEALEDDDEIKKAATEEKRKQRRNGKIYQVRRKPQCCLTKPSFIPRQWRHPWWVWFLILIT